MRNHTSFHSRKETPIERIFRKIAGRKMTTRERACFRLNGTSNAFSPRTAAHGAASHAAKGRN